MGVSKHTLRVCLLPGQVIPEEGGSKNVLLKVCLGLF